MDANPTLANTLTIKIGKDGQFETVSMEHPIHILDLLSLTFTVQLSAMQNFIDSLEGVKGVSKKRLEEGKAQLKEDLYDKYNLGASNVLKMFAPELELHPNLTAEAILKAENEILDALDKEPESE